MRIPAGTGEIHVLGIVDKGIRRQTEQLNGRAVNGDRLDRGAGRTLRAGCPVEREVLRFFSDAAAQTLDLTGIGIHDHNRTLQLLVGTIGLRNVLNIFIDVVDIGLDRLVQAAEDLIAAVIDKMTRSLFADTLLLHEVFCHIGDDDLFVIGIDVLGIGRVLTIDEIQRLFNGGLVGVIVDKALLIHLMQDRLLPLLVCCRIVERIILCRLVCDAYNGGTLGQCEFGDILTEIGLGGGLDAPAALAEIDGVKVPFDNLAFVVFLFQLQRSEDLGQLALHRDLVFAGKVFDQLLRDRRSAVGVGHTGKHLDKSARGAVPVDALVLVKALVLDCDKGFFHIPGNLVIIDPNAFFFSGKRDKFLPAAGGVGIPDRAGFAQLIVFKRDIQRRRQTAFDVISKDAAEDQPGKRKNQQNRTENLQNAAECNRNGVNGEVRRTGSNFAGVDALEFSKQCLKAEPAVFLVFLHLSG